MELTIMINLLEHQMVLKDIVGIFCKTFLVLMKTALFYMNSMKKIILLKRCLIILILSNLFLICLLKKSISLIFNFFYSKIILPESKTFVL